MHSGSAKLQRRIGTSRLSAEQVTRLARLPINAKMKPSQRLKRVMEELKANPAHETVITHARKQPASLHRDKYDFQQGKRRNKLEYGTETLDLLPH